MVLAWRIDSWKEMFEVTDHGNAWDSEKTKMGESKGFKDGPLSYVRYSVGGELDERGLTFEEKRMELEEMVGIDHVPIVEHIYWRMVAVAARKFREYRGWVLTGRSEAMDAALIARRLHLSAAQVAYSLPVLKALRWIAFEECKFAIECVQPVRFGAEDVNLGNLSSSRGAQEKPGESGAPSEPNQTITKTLTKTDTRPGEVEKGKESGCLISSAAEESKSRSESKEAGSEDRKESESKEVEESKESACSRGNQSLKEASPGAEPDGGVCVGAGHATNGALNWEMEIDRLKQTSNLMVESPECLLVGIDTEKTYAKVLLIDRMMVWFRAMGPMPLRPEEAGSKQDEIQARSNVKMCMDLAGDAWEKDGPDGVIEIMLEMQKICVAWKRPGHGGIHNPMGVWVASVRKWLGVIGRIGKGDDRAQTA